MSVTKVRDEGQTLRYPTGKLLGIVDTLVNPLATRRSTHVSAGD